MHNIKYFLMCMISIIVLGCANHYMIPDYEEYTAGGMYEDKYTTLLGGKNVKLEGKFDEVKIKLLGTTERVVFWINVLGGKKLIQIYASRDDYKMLKKL